MANTGTAKLDEKKFDDIKSDVKGEVKDLKKDFKDTASDFGSQARDMMSNVSEKAQNYLGRAQDYGTQALDDVGSYIRRNPSQAVLAGFGLGIFLGLMISRR